MEDESTFQGDDTKTVDEDSTNNAGSLTAADIDGTSTYAVSTQAVSGQAAVDANSGAYTYTPSSNFNGQDEFTVRWTNSLGGTTDQKVTITVKPMEDEATFRGDETKTIAEDSGANSGSLTASDIDGTVILICSWCTRYKWTSNY